MSRKSSFLSKILNDTLDLMTLMTLRSLNWRVMLEGNTKK